MGAEDTVVERNSITAAWHWSALRATDSLGISYTRRNIMTSNTETRNRPSRRSRIIRYGLYVCLGLVLILIPLNVYGRQPFDPAGSDSVSFNPEDLKPGKNTVEYLSNGSRISAHLFIPEDYVEGEKRPAIVITPPNTGVKEQTAGIYAEELSKQGFFALAFDPRGFGDSGGHPLFLDPLRQVEDAKSSIDFISTLEQVDENNIFNMGLCVGSGISAHETAYDSRIKAQAMVSPFLAAGDEVALPIPGNLVYIIAGLAKAQYAITGNDIEFGPICPETEEAQQNADPFIVEMGEYYLPGMPGGVPNWKNRTSMISLTSMVELVDYFAFTDRFDSIPVYVVYGTEALSKDGAITVYDQLNGPKERLVLEGAGHFDIYWMPEYVGPAVEGISAFFGEYVEK
jgi:fermentation-respiration switch protein FrsA (DUF1100 family)